MSPSLAIVLVVAGGLAGFLLSRLLRGSSGMVQAPSEGEERYRQIFQRAAVSFWVNDLSELKAALDTLKADGVKDIREYLATHPDFVVQSRKMIRVREVNDATLAMFEATSKEELLASIDKIFTPEAIGAFQEALISLADGMEHCETETANQTLRGKPIHLLMSISFPKDQDGHGDALVTLTDITRLKRAEERLRAFAEGTASAIGEDFFRSLVHYLALTLNVRYAVVTELADPAGKRLRAKAIWIGTGFGEPFEYESRGTPCEHVVTSMQPSFHPRHTRKLFPDDVWLQEMKIESYMAVPVLGASGNALGHICVMDTGPRPDREHAEAVLNSFVPRTAAEIERRRAQEEKDRAQALLQAAIDHMPAGVMVAEAPDVTIRMLNSAALDILGETQQSLLHKQGSLYPTRWRTLHPDGTPRAPEERWLAKAVLRGETVRNEEVILERKDGQRRWVLGSAAPIRGPGGEIVAGVVAFRDITEVKKAEDEKQRLQEELRRSESLSAMGSLLAGVAHEVRNPLFSISATLDAFEARFWRQEAAAYLDVLHREVDRLGGLMRDLLEYGRAPGANLARGALDRVIARAITALEPQAQELGVSFDNHIADGLAPIMMDRDRMREVFQNLLENALQHSPPGGSILIEAKNIPEGDDEWIECSIQDAGPGFKAEDLPKVFEPFFSHRPGGTGMGLSIVKRIVEDHGGTVLAANGETGGAVVAVRIRAGGRQDREQGKRGSVAAG